LWGAILALALPLGCNSGTPGGDPCPGGICTGTPDGGSGACVETWVCSPWTTSGAGSNQGTRTCTDSKACGTTLTKPAEVVVLPALDLEFFKCNVQPVFDHKCAQLACHGSETDRALRIYARGRLRNAETLPINTPNCNNTTAAVPLATQCTGSLEGPCRSCTHTPTEWQRDFDSARGFALDANLKPIAAGLEDTSDLLAQPKVGGKSHANIHLFQTGDADYTNIKQWLGGAKYNGTCPTLD
jgi:hypothetical protein